MRFLFSAMAMWLLGGLHAQAQIKAPGYKVEQLVKPSAFHGVHGMAFDANDVLYAGSVVGQRVYKVDTVTGKVEVVVESPEGMADDIVFLQDGTMVWTAISQNMVRARKGDGPIKVLAEKLASVNSINVRKSDGRLFVAQVFGGDGLWELDPSGAKPPRNILKDIGGLNGFDIGPEGWIYGPLWFKKQVVKINPDTGELKVIADGFHTPAAVNFDSKFNLYVLDTALGTVNHVDIKTGAKKVVAQLETSLDNLAIDSKDRVFVSNMADNGIQEVDVKTGKARQVVKGELAMPVGISAVSDGKRDIIYVADVFAYRSVDGDTGAVTDLQRSHAADAKIGYASGVSVSAQHVLVINSNGTLQKYRRSNGALLKEWPNLRGLTGAVELPNGDVLIAQGGALVRIDARDQRKTVAENLGRVQSLWLAGDRGVCFLNVDTGEIVHVDFADGAKRVIASNLKTPQGLVVDNRGQLITVEFDSKRLLSIDPESGKATEIASGLPINFRDSERAERAIGLTIGGNGAIYMTSDVENSIYKFTRQ
jgi:sugar lactone lactonase YvrE